MVATDTAPEVSDSPPVETSPPPLCDCDAGDYWLRLSGDGDDQEYRQPLWSRTDPCRTPGPGLVTDEQYSPTRYLLGACLTSDTKSSCLYLNDGTSYTFYLDRGGIKWILSGVALKVTTTKLHLPATGTFVAMATSSLGAKELKGSFSACWVARITPL